MDVNFLFWSKQVSDRARRFTNSYLIKIELCFYFSGPSFIQFIDQLPTLSRRTEAPFVMPIIDKYRDMGTYVMGKVEAGVAKKGQTLLLMPNRVSFFIITNLFSVLFCLMTICSLL